MEVLVTKWPPLEVDARECLELILDDADEIDGALKSKLPWTSPELLPENADAFIDSIVAGGGAAAREAA